MARNKFPEETERKILEVSFRLFQEKGYDHTTIQDIVNGLGMSKGAVYHHFKSKEEILDRLYDRAYTDSGLFRDLDAASLTGLEKIRELFRRQFTDPGKLDVDNLQISYEKNPKILHLLLTSSVKEGAPILQAMLEEGIADGSVTTAYPKEMAESLLILFNLWVGVFSSDREDFYHKLRYLKDMTDSMGVPVFDASLMAEIDRYYDHISAKFHRPSAQTGHLSAQLDHLTDRLDAQLSQLGDRLDHLGDRLGSLF